MTGILEELKLKKEELKQKQNDYKNYIYSLNAEDLQRFYEKISTLETKKAEIQNEISATQEQIQKSNSELSSLKLESTVANVDEKVKSILELEKKIELLNNRFSTLSLLIIPIDKEIPLIQRDIKALKQHLIAKANTEKIEPYVEAFKVKLTQLEKLKTEVDEQFNELLKLAEENQPHLFYQNNGYPGIFRITRNSVHITGYSIMKQE